MLKIEKGCERVCCGESILKISRIKKCIVCSVKLDCKDQGYKEFTDFTNKINWLVDIVPNRYFKTLNLTILTSIYSRSHIQVRLYANMLCMFTIVWNVLNPASYVFLVVLFYRNLRVCWKNSGLYLLRNSNFGDRRVTSILKRFQLRQKKRKDKIFIFLTATCLSSLSSPDCQRKKNRKRLLSLSLSLTLFFDEKKAPNGNVRLFPRKDKNAVNPR